MSNSLMGSLLYPTQIKRKVFVSYHHGYDQWFYNEFSRVFSNIYDVICDNSLDRVIDSDDPEYVLRRIREKYITGSSCTIVLCGAETPNRKYVDWEIKATLDKQHGLIGVKLPTSIISQQGKVIIPDRLYDNIQTGYAFCVDWEALTAQYLKQCIELANSKPASLINNSRPMMRRNRG